jgi:hypothetical protein
VSAEVGRFVHDNPRYGLYSEEFIRAGMLLLGGIEVAPDYYLWVLADPYSGALPYLGGALRS